ncbi:ABC transporter permease [Sphaerisporangium rufum]|uniref:ABC transporter permease n=1 Tax=Sphaerisporangium rufum TaxID=1381558 RepID=UPI0019524E01|nr:ABC transporter permease [Sphaerisporangium rufum]
MRDHRSAFAATFVTVVLGVAIMAMTSLTFASAGPRLPDRLAAVTVAVQAPVIEKVDGDFSPARPWPPGTVADLTARLAAIPGVARAVPDRSFYAQPVIKGRPVPEQRGYPWQVVGLAPYRLVEGVPPRGDGQVALDRSLGVPPGVRLTVLTARGPAAYLVTGTVDGPGVYLSDATAGRLAGGVRFIGLVTEPGADVRSVEAAARRTTARAGRVLAGDSLTALEALADARTRWIGTQVLSAMTALAVFVTGFVVATTSAFGVSRRRREFALLRTIGATPRQVRRLVYGEALVVGGAAAALGALLGAVAAPLLGAALVGAGFEPPGLRVAVGPAPLAATFGGGVLVTLAGAWSAARRAARVSPLAALREADVDDRPIPRIRWITGVLLCAGGLAAAVTSVAAAADGLITNVLVSAMAMILGIAALAPAVVPATVRLVTRPLHRSRGATGVLVRESALAAVRRTASTAAPVLVMVGCAVLITGMVRTTAAAFAAVRATEAVTGPVVVPAGGPGLTDAAVTAAGGAAFLPTAVYRPDGRAVMAAGVTPRMLESARSKLIPLAGSPDSLGEREAIVARKMGADPEWRPGTMLSFAFEDGVTVRVKVVAVVDDAPVEVILPYDLVRAHDPPALAEEAHLRGAPAAGTLAALGARVVDAGTHAAEADAEEDRLVWTFTVLLVIVSAGYAAIAVAGTLGMAAAGRVRDITVLRLAGATTGQAVRALAVETALVVAVGAALGVMVAVPALAGMRAGLAGAFGVPVPLVVPWPLILGIVGGCLLLAVAAAVTVPHRALRRPA